MLINLLREYTATIDIDCQKGFTPLCPDELPIPHGHTIVNELNRQATFARLRICTKDWHPVNAIWIATKEHPQLSYISAFTLASHPNVDFYWNAHCIAGTRGAELLDGLPKETDYNLVIYKGLEKNMHPYGAAYHDLGEKFSTGLIEFLKYHQITNVLLGGLALDYCVLITAKQLAKKGFNVVVNLEACRALGSKDIVVNDLCRSGILTINNVNDLYQLCLK